MKKFMSLVLAMVAIVALSACGGGGNGDDSPPVKIADLKNGYGVEFDDGDAYIGFCNGVYDWYDENGTTRESGDVVIDGTTLKLVADDENITSLETGDITPGELHEGRIYEVTEDGNSFNVEVTWITIDKTRC